MVIFNRFLFRRNIKKAREIVFVSDTQKKKFISKINELNLSTSAKLSVIYNSFDLYKIQSIKPQSDEHKNQIVIATGSNNNKNIELVRSFIRHLSEGNNSQITARYGITILNCTIEEFMCFSTLKLYEEKFGKKIRFCKNLEKNEYFQVLLNAKLVIAPSIEEGFGRILIEAAAVKSEILASDIKVFDEILGVQRLKFNPHNLQEFVACVFAKLRIAEQQYFLDVEPYSRSSFNSSWGALINEANSDSDHTSS